MTEQPPEYPTGGYPPPGGFPPPPPGGFPPPPPPPPPPGYPPPPTAFGGYAPPPPVNVIGQLPQSAYTSWFTRVLAYLIDMIPVFLVQGIAIGISLSAMDCVSSDLDYGASVECSGTSTLGSLATGLAGLLTFAYAIWNFGYRQGTTGSSIGKSVMKFKVVSERTGQPIGFGMSVVRQLAHVVDAIICYIGYLFPLWDAKRQTLADKIISTVCLPTEPAVPVQPLQI